jgi:thiol-disulfide isomerase/thioredoxin
MRPGVSLKDLGWVLPENVGHMNAQSPDPQRSKISDFRGRVLVLDFYATWCAPCRESVPRLVELQRRYATEGLEIVGLNVGGADDRVKVPEFQRELGIQYSLGFPEQALTDFLLSDDATIPQTFVLSREGMIMKRFVGYESATSEMLEQAIKTEIARPADQ